MENSIIKITVFCSLLIISSLKLFGQGSDCAGAPTLTVETTCVSQAYSVSDDGTKPLEQCATGTGYEDGWYEFVATDVTTTLTIDSDEENFMFSVYESCGGTNIECQNVLGGASSTISLTTIVGNSYFIQIQRTSAIGSGNSDKLDMTGNICLYSAPQVCDDLVVSTTTFSQTGLTTCGSGDDFDSGDACGSSYMGGEDFVIEYTPNTTECVDITLTNTDTWTGVFLTDECPNSGTATCIRENTNSSGNPVLTGVNVTAGQTYYITVSTFPSPDCTPFDIEVVACPPPPPNDECSNATAVTVNSDDNCGSVTPGTLTNATQSSQTNDCGGTANDDVWYSFTATSSVHTIDLNSISGSPTDLYHSVYVNNCGSLGTALECSNPNSSIVTGLTPGDTYFVRVYSFSSSAGATTDFDLCVGTPPPPPVNDECSGAVTVTVNADDDCGIVTSGTLSSATESSQANDCFGTPNDDVWYSFTATGTVHYVDLLNISGSPTDLYHSVYVNNCGSLGTALECSDPNGSTVTGLTPGDTYFIRVYSYSSSTGATTNFDLCVGTPPPPPVNDECSGAITVSVNGDDNCGSITSGTIGGATESSQANDCFGTPNDDVWYSFTATGTVHYVDLLNISGSPTDLYHSVYVNNCGSLGTALECSDPNSSTVTGLTPGDTYFIRVYSYSSSLGATTDFDLCVGTPPPPPINDECSDAITAPVNPDYLCGAIVSGSLISATESSQANDCFGTPNDDVWYSFTATNTTHTIDLYNVSGSTVDLYHSVYVNNCGSLGTALECSDPNNSTVTGLTSGDTYFIRIYSYSSLSGATTNFDLCVGTPPPPPINDECSGAISVSVNTDGTCSITETGSVGSASASSQTNDCNGTANDDVWYSFIAQETSQNINLLSVSGSTTDMNFSVYEGSCGTPGAAVLCSDDNYNTVTGLTVGSEYFVRVYTWSSTSDATSSFDLCISNTPPEPDNVTCPDMNPICSGSPISFTASSGGGTADPNNEYDCLTTQPNPTWFFLEIDGSGDLSIDITAGSDVDYAIWGPFNDLTEAQSSCGSYLMPEDCSYSSSEIEQANINNVTAGQVYVLLVTNYADVVQSIFVSESSSNSASTDCTAATPLPVDLISFEAKLIDTEADLYWSTASERGCDYFEVQRSSDGQVWETIGFKEGNGTTQELSTYSFTDKNLLKGISYYRLKQYDFNGSFEMLPTRSIEYIGEIKMIDVFPNPASEMVNVKSFDKNIKNINVYSSRGELVFMESEINKNSITFNCKGFSPSVYFVEVVTVDNIRYIEKLIVK